VLPNETYAGKVAPMESYYILIETPWKQPAEYLLMTPFTPQ